MKKLLLLFLCGVSFSGCYEEDIELALPNDEGLIIGEWESYSPVLVLEDDSEIYWNEASPCFGLILYFFDDGRLRYIDFMEEDGVDYSCIEDPDTLPFGTWNRFETGDYEFILFKSDDELEVQIKPRQILFNENADGNYSMRIIYDGSPENAPEGVKYYYLNFY